eukprot:gene46-1667_t
MSDGYYDALALGRCVPLRKGLKNKVRPIVVPNTIRKICETTVCGELLSRFLDVLAPEQHAVGMTAAIEKLAKGVKAVVAACDDIAVALLDAKGAYNHMLRDVMLQELASDCQEILSFVAVFLCREGQYVFYTDDGEAHVIRSADGCDQGAAISPVAFAFGFRRALRRIRARDQVPCRHLRWERRECNKSRWGVQRAAEGRDADAAAVADAVEVQRRLRRFATGKT